MCWPVIDWLPVKSVQTTANMKCVAGGLEVFPHLIVKLNHTAPAALKEHQQAVLNFLSITSGLIPGVEK